jgi:hypothetical protein
MSALLKASVIFPAFLAAMAMLLPADSDPGQPVSRALCAELRGGANCGTVVAANCTQTYICSNNGYIQGGANDQMGKLNGAATTYCWKVQNGYYVCNDSTQGWTGCGG